MKSKAAASSKSPGNESVDAFMAGLDHPRKDDIEAVRRIILVASPHITEAIKWNAPSFRTTEFFATTNLRSRDQVQLVFHLGAKVRADVKGLTIRDPAGLLKWLAKDRCLVTVGAGPALAANRDALADVVRQWIKHV